MQWPIDKGELTMDNEAPKSMIIFNHLNSNRCFIRAIREIRGQKQRIQTADFTDDTDKITNAISEENSEGSL